DRKGPRCNMNAVARLHRDYKRPMDRGGVVKCQLSRFGIYGQRTEPGRLLGGYAVLECAIDIVKVVGSIDRIRSGIDRPCKVGQRLRRGSIVHRLQSEKER